MTCLPAPYYLPAVSGCILGNAMLGRNQQAQALIHEHDSLFSSYGSPAISQAWALCVADGYALLGDQEQAEEQGLKGTSGANANIHQERYAGPFARWVARTSLHRGQSRNAHATLSEMMKDLQNYDVIDRAEIVNANTWLNATNRGVSSREIGESLDPLALLPPAVTDQLRRMGMLDFVCD